MLERYYNTGRFVFSTEYLFTLFPSPFDFFEALAMFWEAAGLNKLKHRKESYYNQLVVFGETVANCDMVRLKESIRFDWFVHEKIKEVPAYLQTYNEDDYKPFIHRMLKDEEWIAYLGDEIGRMTSKQRIRHLGVSYFQYDFYSGYQSFLETGKGSVPNILTKKSGVIFDYNSFVTRCYQLPEVEGDLNVY